MPGSVLVLLALAALEAEPCETTLEIRAPKPASVEITGQDSNRSWSAEAPTLIRLHSSQGCNEVLRFASPGYWAPPLQIQEAETTQLIELLPAGQAKGQLIVSEETTDPEIREVEVTVQSTSAARSIGTSKFTCPAVDQTWLCTLPAGELDLKVRVPGYAPLYYWSVAIIAGQLKEVAPRRLMTGASLAGWVETEVSAPEGSPPAEVTLKPVVLGWQGNPEEKRRSGLTSSTVTTNDRGFFQFVGLSPKSYQISAACEGFSRSQWRLLAIDHGEHFLDPPITLTLPMGLDLYLDPPTAPRDQSWIIALLQKEPKTNAYRLISKSPASSAGYWQADGLSPGDYRLEVRDLNGSMVHSEEVLVEGGRSLLTIELSTIAIEGTIRMGEEPVQAKLVFGTLNRRPNVHLKSDQSGRFEGYLPRSGLWDLEIVFENSTVEVASVEVEPEDGKAFLQINLADTRLEGEVSRQGQPVSEALVNARRKLGPSDSSTRAMDFWGRVTADGQFEFTGLEPGSYWVRAKWRGEQSDWQLARVEEGQDTPAVRLKLRSKKKLRGHLLIGGQPVAGARIEVRTLSASQSSAVGEGISKVDGSFEIDVPPSLQSADLLIIPPSLPVELLRVTIDDKPLEIEYPAIQGDLEIELFGVLSDGMIHRSGASVPLSQFLANVHQVDDRVRRISGAGGVVIENLAAGEWTICGAFEPADEKCASASIQSGSVAIVSE